MSKLLSAAVLVAMVALGGCGNDTTSKSEKTENQSDNSGDTDSGDNDAAESASVELSGDEKAFAADLAAGLAEGENEGFPNDQAECWSSRLVDDFGVDRLEEVGITAESMSSTDGPDPLTDLTDDEKASFTAGFVDCIDLVEVMIAAAEADGTGDTSAMKACLEGSVSEKTEEAFAQVLIEGDEVAENDSKLQAAMAPIMGCAFMGLGEGMDMPEDTTTTTG